MDIRCCWDISLVWLRVSENTQRLRVEGFFGCPERVEGSEFFTVWLRISRMGVVLLGISPELILVDGAGK